MIYTCNRIKSTDTLTASHKDIKTWYNALINKALDQDIVSCLQLLREKVKESGLNQYLVQIEGITENYRFILGFFEKGTPDEKRNDLHSNIIRKILEVTDRINEDLLLRFGTDPISEKKRSWVLSRKPYGAEATHWAEGLAIDQALKEILEGTQVSSATQTSDRKEWLDQLFTLSWLPDKLQDEEADALTQAILNDQIPWYERAVLTSGISLGLLRSFDQARITALLRIIQDTQVEVRVRALTGIIFAMYLYQKRLSCYPQLQEKIAHHFDLSADHREVEAIHLQWLRSLDTEALGKTLREELLPGMIRITPKITERLKLDEIFPGESETDKNPDWEGVFHDDPDLLEKLQRFTERHLAGDDVFMSVFAQQKHYPFFHRLDHWFLPFHIEESVVADILATQGNDSGIARMIRDMESTHLLSHSDKYSFVLNLSYLTDMQKDLLKASFSSEMEEYQKISAEEETLDDMARFRNALKMHMQDLYRFHQLHEYRQYLPHIFKISSHGVGLSALDPYLKQHGIQRTIAYFHFEREHWKQAAHALSMLAESEEASHSLFEKAGYAYQQTDDFEKAIGFYQKAELFDTNRLWLLKRMSYCYRKSGKYQDALKLYDQGIKAYPEDLSLLIQSANILLEIKDYQEALHRYQEAELKDADNIKLLRPLAWCHLNLLEAESALKALERIPQEERSYFDYMNIGHALWMLGKVTEAATQYREGMKQSKGIQEDFLKGYMEDRQLLHQAGISKTETAMMADLLRELPF